MRIDMTQVTYVGVDPGDTTGIFVVSLWWQPIPSGVTEPVRCEHGHLEFPSGDVDRRLRSEVSGRPWPVRVASEKFSITQRTIRTKRRPAALEVTGVVKQFAADFSATLAIQQKSESKRMGTNERLREWGWWMPGYGHANDAARQVVRLLSGRDPGLFRAIISRGIVTIASKAIRGSEED